MFYSNLPRTTADGVQAKLLDVLTDVRVKHSNGEIMRWTGGAGGRQWLKGRNQAIQHNLSSICIWEKSSKQVRWIFGSKQNMKLESPLSFSLFARWFQPTQTSQPTMFSSHKKLAPASPNQHQHQPTNRPINGVNVFASSA